MSLTVGTRAVADIRIQSVTLRPVLGAHELCFQLHVNVIPADEQKCVARIAGAHVALSGKAVGFARADVPFTIRPQKFLFAITPVLRLMLHPRQLAAIEEVRNGGDLAFELLAFGEGVDATQGECSVQDNWRVDIARSAWIDEMRRSGAMNVLLIELSLPLGAEMSEEGRKLADTLLRAQKSFFSGDYHSCVSLCRGVLHDLGHMRYRQQDWANALLDSFATNRKAMSKDDRGALILAAVMRHYTNQAHHTESEGGITSYSRSEATMVLNITAALIAHAQAG